ncbi:MAG: hypothetical protein ACOY0T_08095 [Myxococcota bacterium]
MARLIAATCPKCGAGVRLDPDKSFVTCSYCGVSSFVETPKRRATEQIQQAQPVIHIERIPRSLGCFPALITVVIILIAIGAFSGQLLGNLSLLGGRGLGISSGKPFTLPISLPSGVSFVPTPVVEEDIFKDPTIVKRRFEERLGKPVMVKELVLYPTYAIAEAQDPKAKHHLDRYVYRNATLGDPDPVRLSGSERDVDRLVFSLDKIAFDKLPAIIQAAPVTDLPLEEAKVTHVIITRDVFSKQTPVFRIYVSGPRDSGYVEYDANGKRGRVVR